MEFSCKLYEHELLGESKELAAVSSRNRCSAESLLGFYAKVVVELVNVVDGMYVQEVLRNDFDNKRFFFKEFLYAFWAGGILCNCFEVVIESFFKHFYLLFFKLHCELYTEKAVGSVEQLVLC